METRTVALYGDNLVMSSIGASLQQKPEIQVRGIEGPLSEIFAKLDAAPPDVILFDLASVPHHFAISLLHNYPMVTVIGIDLAGNKMLVLSCKQSRLLTADDLVNVISP